MKTLCQSEGGTCSQCNAPLPIGTRRQCPAATKDLPLPTLPAERIPREPLPPCEHLGEATGKLLKHSCNSAPSLAEHLCFHPDRSIWGPRSLRWFDGKCTPGGTSHDWKAGVQPCDSCPLHSLTSAIIQAAGELLDRVVGDRAWWHNEMQVTINGKDQPSYAVSRNSCFANYQWRPGKPIHAVGSIGWNWVERRTEWIGFEFDSKKNHANGLSDARLSEIRSTLEAFACTELRRSSSGLGLHCRVRVPPTATNLAEHRQLAYRVLNSFGQPIARDADACGITLWLWRDDAGPGGFELLKAATEPYPADVLSANWPLRARMPVLLRESPVPGSCDASPALAGLR